MSKNQLTKLSTGHSRFEAWDSDKFYKQYCKIDARRVMNGGRDEAQIELTVAQTPVDGKRTTTVCSTMVLTPSEARALALALCPELLSPEEP